MTTAPTTLVFVEHVLWEPTGEWDAALDHIAQRFARSAPLDVDAVRASGALHQQVEALRAWADGAGADIDRELGRWFDEHLAMHVRPDPNVTRAVRALAHSHAVHLGSALPPRAAESVARHTGCWRSATELHGSIVDARALTDVLNGLPHAVLVAGQATPLPPDVTAMSLDDVSRQAAG